MFGSIKFAPLDPMRFFLYLTLLSCIWHEPSLVRWRFTTLCYDWPLPLIYLEFTTLSQCKALKHKGFSFRPLTIHLIAVPACRCQCPLYESFLKLKRASHRSRARYFYGRELTSRKPRTRGKFCVFHLAFFFKPSRFHDQESNIPVSTKTWWLLVNLTE